MCSYGVPSDSKNRSYQNRLIKKLLQDSSAAKKRRETNKQDLDQETVYQEEEEEITNKLLYQKTCDQFFVQERQRDTDTEIGNPKCKYLEIRSKNCLEFDPREENCNKMRTNFALKRTRERDREREREREKEVDAARARRERRRDPATEHDERVTNLEDTTSLASFYTYQQDVWSSHVLGKKGLFTRVTTYNAGSPATPRSIDRLLLTRSLSLFLFLFLSLFLFFSLT